jgi:ankyrin repeat protein
LIFPKVPSSAQYNTRKPDVERRINSLSEEKRKILLDKVFSYLPKEELRNDPVLNQLLYLNLSDRLSEIANKSDLVAQNNKIKGSSSISSYELSVAVIEAFEQKNFTKAKTLILDASRLNLKCMQWVFKKIEDIDVFEFIDCMKLVKEKTADLPLTVFSSQDLGLENSRAGTPLMHAIAKMRFDDFFGLLEYHHIDPHEENPSWGGNALFLATGLDRFKFLAYLVEISGLNIESREKSGATPLYYAIDSGGDTQTIRYLLEKGADPNIETNIGDTPLKRAIRRKDTEIIALLISKGADIHAADSKRQITPLMEAVEYKSFGWAKNLLSRGCNIDSIDKFGHSCVTRAICKRYLQFLGYLVSRGAVIRDIDREKARSRHIVIPTNELPQEAVSSEPQVSLKTCSTS